MFIHEEELSSTLLSDRQREMISKYGCGSVDINIDSIDDLGGLVINNISHDERIESKHYLAPKEVLHIFESVFEND